MGLTFPDTIIQLTDVATLRAAPYSIPAAGADAVTDAALNSIIDGVTSAIEREIDRHIGERDYEGWHDGTGTRVLTLPEWPLVSVTRVAIGTVEAINVQATDADTTDAFASITRDTGGQAEFLRLQILDGANAGTVDLTLAVFTPISQLAAAVNLQAGWTASASTAFNDRRSVLLRPTGGREARDTSAWFDMPDRPETDYDVDYDYGEIISDFGFARGKRNVFIQYRAGYDPIPPALVELANKLVVRSVRAMQRDGTLKSETLGDYSYTIADGLQDIDMTADWIQRALAPFKDNVV